MTRITFKIDYSDKVVIITGGGSGIGRATALAFASSGAKVVVADLNDEGGNETVHLIKGGGGDSIFIKTDVSRSDDVIKLVNKTIEAFGQLDYAFNNAGIAGPSQPLTDQTEDLFDTIMNINVKGIWLCMKYEIPAILKSKNGENQAIVNMSSVAGIRGLPVAHIYSASKHAVVGLTQSAALEYAKSGIRINAVAPSVIETPGLAQIKVDNPQIIDQIVARHPMGRTGTPEEVADTVLWLCSDAASYVTGQLFIIDGGYSVQ